ncbi:MAG: PD40 domain-containing protein, partial [Gammaproteobacteria bacterium]|nr:PD40 domain-containing protein [Gammaproteobacteria bacterium]
MLLILQDPTEQEREKKTLGEGYREKTAPPWVIDRLQFKEDYVGYLDRRRTHIHVLTSLPAPVKLTTGDYDDSEAAWSPDGSHIAFTSNRSSEPDSNSNTDIWVVDSATDKTPAELIRISDSPGPDASPPGAGWQMDHPYHGQQYFRGGVRHRSPCGVVRYGRQHPDPEPRTGPHDLQPRVF